LRAEVHRHSAQFGLRFAEVWSNREQLSIFKILLDSQGERILSEGDLMLSRAKAGEVLEFAA
jgi:hypothetical protein